MQLWLADGELDLEPRRLVVAGYTGRDPVVVRRHIEELREAGIPAPPDVPMFWELPVALLRDSPSIEVAAAATSGEVEPVLLVGQDGGWYVGLGSDHTDRALERLDVGESKRACPKVIAPQVWPYAEVRERWDEIGIRSRVHTEAGWVAYQEGTLAALLTPEQVMDGLRTSLGIGAAPGLVVFLGTLPLLHGAFVYAREFAMEMTEPGAGRSLRWQYEVDLRR